ncbi:hypothetical protein AMECASPLE_027945 [Ameca splendens]|uniref:Uncharacterized protein n=1 Tax=Ameca splendens TaxID=208324 RepID=A0ABV0YT46_9TELE
MDSGNGRGGKGWGKRDVLDVTSVVLRGIAASGMFHHNDKTSFRRHFFHSSPVAHADVTRFFVAGGGGEWIGLQRELSREVTDVTGINVHRV